MFQRRCVDRLGDQSKPDGRRAAVRRAPRRCQGCGILLERLTPASVEWPGLLAMHLAASPDCVDVYCRDADNLVNLGAGNLAIRQTLFVWRSTSVAGIAPTGQRRVFYRGRSRKDARAWLAERIEN